MWDYTLECCVKSIFLAFITKQAENEVHHFNHNQETVGWSDGSLLHHSAC